MDTNFLSSYNFYRFLKKHLNAIFLCLFVTISSTALAASQDFFLLNAANIKYQPGKIQMELIFTSQKNAEIEKMLKNSISINIDCVVNIEKNRSFLPNKNIYTYKQGGQLRYEPLTREYVLYQEKEAPIRKKDLNELIDVLFNELTLSLDNVPELEKEGKYSINLSLGMRHGEVPPWLENTLFFWKWDIISQTYTFDLRP